MIDEFNFAFFPYRLVQIIYKICMNVLSMKDWTLIYDKIAKHAIDVISNFDDIILGFNVNVDKVIYISPAVLDELLLELEIEKKGLMDSFDKVPAKISTPMDLIFCLINSISKGIADEKLIVSDDLNEWIENHFIIEEKKIGGQAGIMANMLSDIGLKNILISVPAFQRELKPLLNPNIKVGVRKNGSCAMRPINEMNFEDQGNLSHYIFEFKQGKYLFDYIDCKRDNRFIASSDHLNTTLKINSGFKYCSKQNISVFKLAIISGFHLINSENNKYSNYKSLFSNVEQLLAVWKRKHACLLIHLELAAFSDDLLKSFVINRIFPRIDSLGLNEQELLSLLIHFDRELYQELRNEMNAINLFKGLHKLWKSFPKIRFHLHYLDFYLVLSKSITKDLLIYRRNSLVFAALMGYQKAKTGSIKSLDDLRCYPSKVSSKGWKHLTSLNEYLLSYYNGTCSLIDDGFFYTKEFALNAIPTVMVKKPKSLVGLGDTISLSSILAEQAFKYQPKLKKN